MACEWFGPFCASGWAAVLLALPMTEVPLKPAETREKRTGERGIEIRMKSAHGLAEHFADGLVRRFAGGTGVDEVAGLDAEGDSPIDEAFPSDSAFGKAMGMFFKEEGFGATVAHLLFKILPGGGAAVVPDEGRSGEAEGETGLAESPAEVDIVPGGVEDGVEPVDFLKSGFFDGEMTTGEVLGGEVIDHDVGGGSGCGGGESEREGIGPGGEVWSADGGMF